MRRRLCVLSMLTFVGCINSSLQADSWVYVSVSRDRHIAQLELDGKTGGLTLVTRTELDGEPAGLVKHPSRNLMFAAIRSRGQLAAFRWNRRTGGLSSLQVIEADADPAFLTVDHSGEYLLSAYYRAGKVAVHRIKDSGHLTPNQWMKTADKAHCIRLDVTNRFALVPHTGPNQIWILGFSDRTGKLSPRDPAFIAGDPDEEPRHILFHPRLAVVYAVNERGDSVAVYQFDARQGTLQQIQKLSTIPHDYSGVNACADLEMTPDSRFLYASNRGHDSLAAFRLDPQTGRLSEIGQFATESVPRQFSITADGRYLVAAGQGNGYLRVFRIRNNGDLAVVHRMQIGDAPWWVLAVPR